MLEEIQTHLAGETTIQRVEIVLFDASAAAIFERVFSKMDG
jgi:hypothetical protein